MKRKALALAVGAVFAAPAAHAQLTLGNDQVGTLQIYGKFYPQIATFKGDSATQPGATGLSNLVTPPAAVTFTTSIPDHGNRVSVDSQNSYLGFRGERKLMGGWKGLIQLEQSIDLDTGSGAGVFSNRNSFAGMGHDVFGTIKLGNMDTIYKEYGDTMGMFGIASGNFISASNVLSHIGIGSNNNARFHERRANSMQYQTGQFGGFQAGVQYSPDELSGDPGRVIDVNTLSYGVKFDSEMFYVSVQQEVHRDFFGGSSNVAAARANSTTGASSKDTGTRVSAEFRFFGSQRIVGDLARLEYKESGQVGAGRFVKYEKTNWAIGWDGGFGPWRLAAQYVEAGEGSCELTGGVACTTDGLGATLISLGVRYRFDRQTFVYAIGARVNMDPAALHDNWANGTPSRGSTTTQTAIGISYTF